MRPAAWPQGNILLCLILVGTDGRSLCVFVDVSTTFGGASRVSFLGRSWNAYPLATLEAKAQLVLMYLALLAHSLRRPEVRKQQTLWKSSSADATQRFSGHLRRRLLPCMLAEARCRRALLLHGPMPRQQRCPFVTELRG